MNGATVLAITCAAVILFSLAPGAGSAASGDSAEKRLPNPFFAMDTGTKDARHETAKAQAEMLKEFGYAGIGYTGFADLGDLLKELDANGLALFTIYLAATIEPDSQALEPGLEEGIKALKGRNTILWITMNSQTYKPSSPEGDARAAALLREVADKAAESGLRVALYPHTGCWLERVEDAVRVAKQVDRKNVGVTFNLCHWLNAGKGRDLKPLLQLAKPYLFVVTINGADTEGGWDRLIQTLDRGTFDICAFLVALKDLGYTGPIGLQGYGIGGDVRDNLKRSMAAWRTLSRRAAETKP
jgi:sugar phosphate isomerase/epimerase